MLAMLKSKLTGASDRMSGRTDLLEAVCASAALVAAADGDIDDSEIEATTLAVSQSPVLSAGFQVRAIEQSIEKMLVRAGSGRAGRAGLYKEIDDIAANPEDAELVLLTAMDVADADGEMDAAEKAVIGKIAKRLGLNPDNYDV